MPHLFADADPSNTQVLIATIVVGGMTTIASAYFAMRAKEEPIKLKAQVEGLEKSAKDCEEDREELKADRDRMSGQIDTLIGRVKAVEKAPAVRPFAASPPADGSGPHAPIADDDATDEHDPLPG
jgi:hypothetical protein